MAGITDDFSTGLPLDSPNWLSIHDVIGSLRQSTANRRLAARDLMAKLVNGDVHSLRRCFVEGRTSDGKTVLFGPDRELVLCSFWADHVLDSWSDRTFVRCVHRGRVCYNQYFVFYVWRPDLVKIWPTIFGPSSSSSLSPSSSPPSQEPSQQPQPQAVLELANSTSEPPAEKRPTKEWLEYAINQQRDELAGLKTQTAAKRLAKWMAAGLYNPEKPVGWHRLKNIGRELEL